MKKQKKNPKSLLVLSWLVVVLFGINPAEALAAAPIEANKGTLPIPGTNQTSEFLLRDQHGIVLENNGAQLIWEKNGNLTLYFCGDGVLWTSNTGGKGTILLFQSNNGRLVIKDSNGSIAWSTMVDGGDRLRVTKDRNLVLFNSSNSKIWETKTTLERLNSDGLNIVYPTVEAPIDFMIPLNPPSKYISFRAEGADGGRKVVKESWGTVRFVVDGGSGATIKGTFEIGTGDGQIPPGSIVRMIMGFKGGDRTGQTTSACAGGGGTGIVVKTPGTLEWKLLMVAGGGGGSYLTGKFKVWDGVKISNAPTADVRDGFVKYEFRDKPEQNAVKLAKLAKKCMDNTGGKLTNGNNIQLWDCGGSNGSGNGNQLWLMQANRIHWAAHSDKCLEVTDGKTDNGTNIQLSDCDTDHRQNWIYDGRTQKFRSMLNTDKCLNVAYNGRTDNGTNIILWDCDESSAGQEFVVDVMPTISSPGTAHHIVPEMVPKLAVHSNTGAQAGSNIQLWDKDNTNTAEKWTFQHKTIRLQNHSELCLNLSGGETSNGNNIDLKNCNGTDAQKWMYDSITRTIRSVIDPYKCLEVADGKYEKRANIRIWNCNGDEQQQFLIVE